MSSADLLRISLSLVLVVVILLLGMWFVKRSGLARKGDGPKITILSSQSLGPRSHICVVQVADQTLVLGVTPQNISCLHHLRERSVADTNTPSTVHSPPSFNEALNEATRTS